MLTIKHIAPDGVEFTTEITHAEYVPRKNREAPYVSRCATVIAAGLPTRDTPINDRIFSDGTIYVMNDKGRTIATYYLSMDNGLADYVTGTP